jgi:hypothetical protein
MRYAYLTLNCLCNREHLSCAPGHDFSLHLGTRPERLKLFTTHLPLLICNSLESGHHPPSLDLGSPSSRPPSPMHKRHINLCFCNTSQVEEQLQSDNSKCDQSSASLSPSSCSLPSSPAVPVAPVSWAPLHHYPSRMLQLPNTQLRAAAHLPHQ